MKNAQLTVKLVAALARPMAHQIMNPSINQVPVMFPCFGHSSRLSIMLEDPGAIAIHLAITTSRQPRDSRPNDYDGLFSHGVQFSRRGIANIAKVPLSR